MGCSDLCGAVGAAAIHHHNFRASLTQRLQREQDAGDVLGLVKHGDDDRQLQPASRGLIVAHAFRVSDSSQRATARTSLSCGAAVAMVAHDDRAID